VAQRVGRASGSRCPGPSKSQGQLSTKGRNCLLRGWAWLREGLWAPVSCLEAIVGFPETPQSSYSPLRLGLCLSSVFLSWPLSQPCRWSHPGPYFFEALLRCSPLPRALSALLCSSSLTFSWSLSCSEESRAPLTHTRNPSYSGGRDQESCGLKPAQANSS
jgi:hypothetical protein